MIYKGKQYARIFFKRDSDKERCKMCSFSGPNDENHIACNYNDCFDNRKNGEYWSWVEWVEVGEAK